MDKDTGFITLTMEHESPYIAQKWLSMIIYEINKIYRMEDKKKASLAISYLNKQISLTSLTEIKQALSRLIQNETQKMMLIEANEDYIFKVIDPPIVEEIKSKPKEQ